MRKLVVTLFVAAAIMACSQSTANAVAANGGCEMIYGTTNSRNVLSLRRGSHTSVRLSEPGVQCLGCIVLHQLRGVWLFIPFELHAASIYHAATDCRLNPINTGPREFESVMVNKEAR